MATIGGGASEHTTGASEHISNAAVDTPSRAPQAARPAKETSFFYGWNKLSALAKNTLVVFTVVMRAAHIADFYMTKYQSKAREALSTLLRHTAQQVETSSSEG